MQFAVIYISVQVPMTISVCVVSSAYHTQIT